MKNIKKLKVGDIVERFEHALRDPTTATAEVGNVVAIDWIKRKFAARMPSGHYVGRINANGSLCAHDGLRLAKVEK